MRFSFLLMVLLVGVVPSIHAEVLEGPITRPETGNTYYLLQYSTWEEAQSFAQDSLGGSLALVDDSLENTWIADTFQPLIPDAGTTVPKQLWIGLQYDDVNDTWVGPRGEDLAYVNWYSYGTVTYPQFPQSYPYGILLCNDLAEWYPEYYGTWANNSNSGVGWFGYECHGLVEVEYTSSLQRSSWAIIKTMF